MSAQPGFRWRTLGWRYGRGVPVDRVEQRYTREDGVKFDELVIDDWLHIEEMDSRYYWMRVCGLHINVVVPSKGKPYIASTWEDA